jgi:hypothetical protein
MKDLLKASHELYGDSSLTPPSTDIYISGTLATSEQMTAITAKATELETEWNTNQYQRDRQYPSIGDQLDMQYHDELNGTTTWKDAVAKVKSDNPKG